jgi:hypothetical protein
MIAPQPVLTAPVLSSLTQHKYRNTPGKALLFDFMERFLNLTGCIVGFQSRFSPTLCDLILFQAPSGSTLCVECSVMLLPCEVAREIVARKIAQSEAAFHA